MQFPYYIVRFKHASWADIRRDIQKFPYYIVRFKLHTGPFDQKNR